MSDHHHRPSEDEIYTLPPQSISLDDFECKDGLILDIGAGGEGVIEILKGPQVIGIDKNRKELEETNNDALKMVMDATDLQFLDESFNTVTLFYTLMYMQWEVIDTVLEEVWRVLRPGGHVLIWDAVVQPPEETSKKYFLAPLKILYPDGKIVETGFGNLLRSQAMIDFIERTEGKFNILEQHQEQSRFFLRLEKLS